MVCLESSLKITSTGTSAEAIAEMNDIAPEPDVGLQEVVLELRVAPGPGLDELPEHPPGDLSLRGQADIDRLGSLRELHHMGALVGLLAGAEPLRLRERAARLEFLERRATQPSRLLSRRPS